MIVYLAHIPIILVHLLNISVYNLESDEFVVGRVAAGNEEEGGITSIHDFRICPEGISIASSHCSTIGAYLCILRSCTSSSVAPARVEIHP